LVDTVLFVTDDTVLREALAFALEHEGFAVRMAGDLALLADGGARGGDCLVIDHGAFAREMAGGATGVARLGIPVILICNSRSSRLMDQANAAGVTSVVEMPLLDGILCREIRRSLDERTASAGQP
jgi:DNA-binding NtrC family response regulator